MIKLQRLNCKKIFYGAIIFKVVYKDIFLVNYLKIFFFYNINLDPDPNLMFWIHNTTLILNISIKKDGYRPATQHWMID